MKRQVVHAIPDRERPARMEVEYLRARVEALEKALREIENATRPERLHPDGRINRIARAALSASKP